MGQENLKGSEGSPHSRPWDRTHNWVWWLMPGIAALDRLRRGGGNFYEKRTGTKGKENSSRAGSGVCGDEVPIPTQYCSCVLSGECWSVLKLEG